MFSLPYFKRVLSSAERMRTFATNLERIQARGESESEHISTLVFKMVNEYRLLIAEHKNANTKLEGALNDPEIADLVPDLRNDVLAIGERVISVEALLHHIKFACESSSSRFAAVIIRVKVDKCLGSVKNLTRLRELTGYFDGCEDYDLIENWLIDEFDLTKCEDCGELEYSSKVCDTYNDDKICRKCAGENYRYSEYYGNYIHYDDSRDAIDRDGSSVVIHYDDDNFLFNDDDDQYQHYDYRPEPKLIGGYHDSKRRQYPIIDDWSNANNNRFFGVELEVEIRQERATQQDKAEQLNNLINDGEVGKRVFFERDGSINYGFEIISQPMSLPAHREMWSWLKDANATAAMRSHNTSTCGLHVHVSRAGLTNLQIAKIVTFINDQNNEHLVRAVARRYAEGYCRIKEKDLGNALSTTDRYEAINVTSSKTIEFRIFKGSLKYESVIAAIEFCHALCEFTKNDEDKDMSKLTMDHFRQFISDHLAAETTTLTPYLETRLELA